MQSIDEVPCPVVITDSEGRIQAINRHALEVIGGSATAWLGQSLEKILPRPSCMFLQTHVWPMLLKLGRVREIHLQLVDAQQHRLPVLVNCDRSLTSEGEQWIWVFFVAKERSRYEAELLKARTRADEAVAAVAEREHFLRTVTNAVPGLVGYWDRDLRCQFANSGYLTWFDRKHDEVIGVELKDLMDGVTLQVSKPFIEAVLQGRPQRFERVQPMPDGRQSSALVNYIPDADADGVVVGFFVLVIDVTALKEAEGQLKLAASIVENTVEAIMVTDEAGRIQSVNPAFTVVTGYSAAEVVGLPASFLDAQPQGDTLRGDMQIELAAHGRWRGETWARRRDGHVFLVRQAVTAIPPEAATQGRQVTVFSDVTERWRSSEHMRHLAFHDALTDLPNRMLLEERLGQLISQAEREDRIAALIVLDLDRFKVVNDTLGHPVGDLLLKAVAKDLLALVRQADTVARLGGDEFVVLLDNVAGRQEVELIARRIVVAVGQVRMLSGHTVEVGASLGIAMLPMDGRASEQLIARADGALYAAKREGRNRYRFFDELGDRSQVN